MNSFIYIQFGETNVDAAHDYLFIFFNFEWFYTLNKNFIRCNSILNDVRDKVDKYFSFYNYYDPIFERIAAHHDSYVKKLQKEINYSQKHE